MTVVVLAGGTGGAKLARGLLDVVGDELVVVANTGDDVEVHGAHVSPDPDLCTFWLADRIDARGWGLEGDTFNVMDGLRELGVEVWFNLGDRDLAIGVERARRIANGTRLTQTLLDLGKAYGLGGGGVLPMADEPVRTRVRAADRWWDFQEFMIVHRGEGPVQDLALDGIEEAAPPPEVLEAIASARAIVLGPSNPVISLGPILRVPGMADALRAADAPVVAVSPFVRGEVVKGPTDAFLRWAGRPSDAAGVAEELGLDLLDGVVHDEDDAALTVPALVTDTLMRDADDRARLGAEVLRFAEGLAA